MKKFLTFAETADQLGFTSEALRRAIATSPELEGLAGYIESGEHPFLAVMQSWTHGVSAPTSETTPGVRFPTDLSGGDEFASFTVFDSSKDQFSVHGLLRMDHACMRAAARTGGTISVALAYSPSWWGEPAFGAEADGPPSVVFRLVSATDMTRWSSPPKNICETLFDANSVAAIQSGTNQLAPSTNIRSAVITKKELTTHLRVIRALCEMAGVPRRGGATSIEAQLQKLGFSGPIDDTIRPILQDAFGLKPD